MPETDRPPAEKIASIIERTKAALEKPSETPNPEPIERRLEDVLIDQASLNTKGEITP